MLLRLALLRPFWMVCLAVAFIACTPQPPHQAVDEWLSKAASARHNGANPELDLPMKLVVQGRSAFEQAIAHGSIPRSHDAASALSRHPRSVETRPLWLTQLASNDAQIRWRALIELADVHAPEDLEQVLRAYLAHSDLEHPLAVRLRDWRDRRTVPVLVELLHSRDNLVAQNAALSLSVGRIPGVPVLDKESDDPNFVSEHRPEGYWTAPPMSHVKPYRRWWASTGREQFSAECTWWLSFTGSARGSCHLPVPKDPSPIGGERNSACAPAA